MSEREEKRNIGLVTVALVLVMLSAGLVIVMALLGVFESGSGGGGDEVAVQCQTDKLAFDQSTACMNDGSVEFCIPADDAEALQRVKDITVDGQCGPGRGRVGCGEGELLCMYFVSPYCESRESTVAQTGWETICAISELPFVDSIAPTWYE